MSEIHFIDTTLRDGNQSLWALNMRTAAMVEIAEQMDRGGFESMEFFVTNMLKKYVREHKENPWDWLHEGTKRIRNTQLRMHGGLKGGLEKKPSAILKLIIERVVASGITLTRTSNCWNDYEVFGEEVAGLRRLGMETVVNLIYSVSPRHTDEYYARKAREAAAIKPYRICFKDVGGLLTPERTRTLVPIVLENTGDTPVEFHAHCNNGLAPLNYLEAIKLGMTTIHTGVPPLANGSAQPSIFNMVKNVRALGHTPLVNEQALEPVKNHFTFVAKRDGLPIGRPREYDHSLYLHQVPGGMISNFVHQLKLVGMEDKLPATLEEAARVRAEWGYPIMVTPLSQFVGTQAAFNVILGERYKEISDQTIQYALGIWGREGAELMDPDIKDKILSRPRAKAWERWEQPDPSLAELRAHLGGPSVSDEELVLRVYAGVDEVKTMLAAGMPREYLSARQPMVRLISELTRQKEYTHVYIRKPGFSLLLGKNAAA
jgi:oxaloacetate decarboxylase alpha subunit